MSSACCPCHNKTQPKRTRRPTIGQAPRSQMIAGPILEEQRILRGGVLLAVSYTQAIATSDTRCIQSCAFDPASLGRVTHFSRKFDPNLVIP
jgi:hypothetical protein